MPKQILLADDSITIQKVIALTFAGEDYKIIAVDNGVDAVSKAREIRPDIILADVVMPQKNGYEVSCDIKNDPELKKIPVLLLAGTFEPFDEDEAKNAGADGFIIKPFESQALIQKVKDLIGGRPATPLAAQIQTSVPAPPKVAPATQPASVLPPKAPSSPVVATPTPVVVSPPKVPPQPVTAPSAKPVVQPVIPSMPPAAPKPVEEEDFWGTMMDEVEEKAAPVKPSPAQTAAVVSSADVWDMGELEEPAPAVPKEEEELWESFAFEDTEKKEEVMEAPPAEEAVTAEEVSFGVEEAPSEVAAVEEEFTFGTEEVAEAEIEEAPEILEEEHVELVEEPAGILAEEAVQAAPEEFTFVEEAAEVYAVPEAAIEPRPEPVPGYEQTFEPESIGKEVSREMTQSEAVPLPGSASLSEDQLRAVLSKVSREVIEKIVWEVVPDLAEMLIKEEIKRLQNKQ